MSTDRPVRPAKPRKWRHPNERPENALVYALEEAVWTYAAKHYVRGTLIDIGCGEKPFAPLFAGHVEAHIGVDHTDTPHGLISVDVIATAYDVPLDNASADTVVMSSVLEHLERPQHAIREAHRLLRPGGHLLITAPMFWHLHEVPRDFYRYTPYGLNHLLKTAGFEVTEILPYSGVWTTVAIELSYALKRRLPSILLQKAGAWLDRVHYQPSFSFQHFAVGMKPHSLGSSP